MGLMGNTRSLWATICEIEPGLYQAIYSNTGSVPDEDNLPAYQSAVSAEDARRRFERSVRAFGYDTITWIGVSAADLFLSRVRHADAEQAREDTRRYSIRL
jgi:hypothetical protein